MWDTLAQLGLLAWCDIMYRTSLMIDTLCGAMYIECTLAYKECSFVHRRYGRSSRRGEGKALSGVRGIY